MLCTNRTLPYSVRLYHLSRTSYFSHVCFPGWLISVFSHAKDSINALYNHIGSVIVFITMAGRLQGSTPVSGADLAME